ncbi:hypothetical protein CEUSTIGMA_g13371.t1, partial [Chlamydomonas eustigma]
MDPELLSLVHGILESCYAEQDAIIGDSADAKAARLAVNPANRLWSKLESHFVGNLKSKVSDVVRQWEDYRSEKMDDLINRTTRLLIDLELVGEKKSLTSVLEKIIRNLPSSFDVWAEVERERSRHDAYNIADFWASPRRKDADLSSKSAHDSASTGLGAFTVRKQHESSVRHSGGHNTNHQAQYQRDGATVTCNHCGRMGHMRAECRSRLAGRAPAPGSVDSKRKHNGGGQNHGKPQGGTSGAAFMAGSIGLQPTSELPGIDNMGMMKWSMDLGSTHTNTPVRECIHEFVSASRPYSIVRDAGGNEHEIRGHGKVIMKVVLPNNEQTTLTMTEVNYVPTFTCNLRANMKYESRGDSEGVGWYLNGKLQFYGAWGTTSPILEADEEVDADMGIKFEDMTNGAIPIRKTLRSDDPSYKSAQKEKQEELLRQKNEETLKRLTAVVGDGTGAALAASTSGRPTSEIVAYRSVADIPAIKDLVIQ